MKKTRIYVDLLKNTEDKPVIIVCNSNLEQTRKAINQKTKDGFIKITDEIDHNWLISKYDIIAIKEY